jgi:predicted DNA-binding antitoxin AbrB/MazE fold protein
MTIKVPAVYEKGVLKLYRELELPDHTYVRVGIEVPEQEATGENASLRLPLTWESMTWRNSTTTTCTGQKKGETA